MLRSLPRVLPVDTAALVTQWGLRAGLVDVHRSQAFQFSRTLFQVMRGSDHLFYVVRQNTIARQLPHMRRHLMHS